MSVFKCCPGSRTTQWIQERDLVARGSAQDLYQRILAVSESRRSPSQGLYEQQMNNKTQLTAFRHNGETTKPYRAKEAQQQIVI